MSNSNNNARGNMAVIYASTTRFTEQLVQRQSQLNEFTQNYKAALSADFLLGAQQLESQLLPLGRPFQVMGTSEKERAENARQLLPLFQNQRDFVETAHSDLLPDDPACARLIAALDRVIGELERQGKEDGTTTNFVINGATIQIPSSAAFERMVQSGPKDSRRTVAKNMRRFAGLGSTQPQPPAQESNFYPFPDSRRTVAKRGNDSIDPAQDEGESPVPVM